MEKTITAAGYTKIRELHDGWTFADATTSATALCLGGAAPFQSNLEPSGDTAGVSAEPYPMEAAYRFADASVGYRLPRPWDSDIAQKLKTEAGLREIALEMGAPDVDATARQAWRQLQSGKAKADVVMRRVAEFRAKKLQAMAATAQEVWTTQQGIARRSACGDTVIAIILAGENATSSEIDRLVSLIVK